ncbi:hypothetical protein COF68_04945 [Bacillus toyonensis]|uniref:hypothetical protein n=1 Tax=Bacillus toyonensis TaxID=155322 RepID=UPI000BFE5509|nr:hypothetical protein [Bacillus toyonensis]PHE64195.1 hypothetical protein COF68_04945 [Bacillus toyonensis]
MNLKSRARKLGTSLENSMLYNRNEFQFISLSYKVLMLKMNGLDITAYKEVLSQIDRSNKAVEVNKQFKKLIKKNKLEDLILIGNEEDTIRHAYRANFFLLKNELSELNGVVNAVELSDLLHEIKNFMLKGYAGVLQASRSMEEFNIMVEVKLESFKSKVDDLIYNNTLVLQYA